MWLRYWGLNRDPFADETSCFVAMPSHDEAVARLVFAIERGHRLVDLEAGAGMGKTTVVRQALRATRNPRRRAILIPATTPGLGLFDRIAGAIGGGLERALDRGNASGPIIRGLRSASIEGTQVVLVLDQWDTDPGPSVVQDLLALLGSSDAGGPSPTIIRSGRFLAAADRSRAMSIGLERLTRSEAETYVSARLEGAGCHDRIFTPRAVGRLHSWSEGVPGTIGELASLAMLSAATHRAEVVTPDLIDGLAMRGLVGIDPSLAPG